MLSVLLPRFCFIFTHLSNVLVTQGYIGVTLCGQPMKQTDNCLKFARCRYSLSLCQTTTNCRCQTLEEILFLPTFPMLFTLKDALMRVCLWKLWTIQRSYYPAINFPLLAWEAVLQYIVANITQWNTQFSGKFLGTSLAHFLSFLCCRGAYITGYFAIPGISAEQPWAFFIRWLWWLWWWWWWWRWKRKSKSKSKRKRNKKEREKKEKRKRKKNRNRKRKKEKEEPSVPKPGNPAPGFQASPQPCIDGRMGGNEKGSVNLLKLGS